jgi:phospholipid/cholesterol/gamma-HCH transport system substrate-binding protein
VTQNKLIGVGVFVLGGALLFTVGLFLIGNRRMAFERSFEVYAEFAQVAGLENGATVRVAGMDAGEVRSIDVPAGPTAPFRVRVRVREDLHRIVRADSVATIQTDGLVGNKFVQIDAGSEPAPEAPDGSTIVSREPFGFADLLQHASATIERVNGTIDELKGEVEEVLTVVSDTARDANELVADVGEDVRAITDVGTKIAGDVEAIVSGVRQGRGTVGKLLTDDALFRQATEIVSEAERTVQNLREATGQARQALADWRRTDGPAQGLAADLRQTLTYAREAMADLSQNAEALKRNFFFRGFFDLADLTPQQYRDGALAGDGRVALRIWLAHDLVFRRDPNGAEELTDEGRARIDSAMSAFLDYPATSPIVVEGYDDAPTRDERFLRSRRRAQLVREYLVAKFNRDANYVGLMPLGLEAPGSPGGDGRWRGVALAIFVEKPQP